MPAHRARCRGKGILREMPSGRAHGTVLGSITTKLRLNGRTISVMRNDGKGATWGDGAWLRPRHARTPASLPGGPKKLECIEGIAEIRRPPKYPWRGGSPRLRCPGGRRP